MANVLDIVDVSTVQNTVGVPDDKLYLLESYITVVSRHIDGLCGPVVQRTVTAEARHGGGCQIVLDKYPILSVTSVTENGTTVAGSGYHVDLRTGMLERLGSSYTPSRWVCGRWNVVVTYEAGRYSTTAAVDSLFSQAAVMAVQGLWESEQAMGGTQGFGAAVDGLDINSVVPGGTQFVLPKAAWMLLAGAGEIHSKAVLV